MSHNREVGTGRYTFDGNLDRPCKCGHMLAVHSAVRLRTEEGDVIQDCMVDAAPDGNGQYEPECPCRCFTPARGKRS